MSQANAVASFAVHLKAVAGNVTALLGMDLDVELTEASPEPYPSLRMHALDDGPGNLEGWDLRQIDLRLPKTLDEWQRMKARKLIRVHIGFRLIQANPRLALLPLLDFENSNSPSDTGLTLKVELNGSRFWRVRGDGPDIELSTMPINIYFTGE